MKAARFFRIFMAMFLGLSLGWWILYISHRRPALFGNAKKHYSQILATIEKSQPNLISISGDGSYGLFSSSIGDEFIFSIQDFRTNQGFEFRLPHPMIKHAWSPSSRQLLYQIEGKDGNLHLYLYDIANKSNDALDAESSPKSACLLWREDSKGIAFYTGFTEGEVSIAEIQNNKVKVLQKIPMKTTDFCTWSSNGRHFVLANRHTLTFHDLVKNNTQVVDAPVGSRILQPVWNKANDALFLPLRMADAERFELFSVKLPEMTFEKLHSEDGDIKDVLPLGDGSYIYHIDNAGKILPVHISHGKRDPIGQKQNGSLTLTSSHDGRVIGNFSAFSQPRQVVSIGLGDKDIQFIYQNPSFDSLKSPDPESIFIGEDKVPAYYWHPLRGKPKGVVIEIHGGTRTYESPNWSPMTKALLDAGISLISLNYRGSGGYGQKWEMATREQQLEDLHAASLYARQVLGFESNQIVLYGSSAGAFISFLSLLTRPHDFGSAVLVSMVGADSVERALGNGKPWSLAVPVAIFQGENDPGATPGNVMEYMSEILSPKNKYFRIQALPEEGHQFIKASSWALAYAQMMAFLELQNM